MEKGIVLLYNGNGDHMKKKLDKNYIVLIVVTLFIIFFCLGFGNLYGSTTDWLIQHSVFPEYFRTLFYETGDLFPDFAPNIGAGQNIFHFSYYGLFNPVYMISYLFPFIEMTDYLMFISILSIIVSVCLMYKWLKDQAFSKTISFVSTFCFLCAAPLLFHSHRHLMFVNYMPFLLLALMGVDRHFEKGRSGLLIFSIFLMILSSYYYSIGGLFAITIYGIYAYLRKIENVTWSNLWRSVVRFAVPVLLGIGLSCFFLLPTAYVILNSRTGIVSDTSVLSVLFPKINMDALLYSSYSLGLTAITFVALIFQLLAHEKENKFLSISLLLLLVLPIFSYLLNGGLYVRSKVLIPFLPVFILLLAQFFCRVKKKEIAYIPSFLLLLIITILIMITGYSDLRFYGDLGVIIIALILFLIFHREMILYIPVIIISFIVVIGANLNENYVSEEEYNRIFSSDRTTLIKKTIAQDPGFYRMNHLYEVSHTMNKIYDARYYQTSLYSSTYNEDYKVFFDSEFRNALPLRNILDEVQTNNALFQMYMGVRYIVTSEEVPIGYEKIEELNGVSVYKNENVLPVFYVSSAISSLSEYQNTVYPYNLENLFQTVVVDHEVDSTVDHNMEPTKLLSTIKEQGSHLTIEKTENGYFVSAKKKDKLVLELETPIVGELLFIEMKQEEIPSCSSGDISIKINGITNKLTCESWMYFNENTSFEYILSSNEPITTLEIEFSEGEFQISDIQTYVLDYESVRGRSNEVIPFEVDLTKTKGDHIEGTIEVTEDGYFATTLPYDEGFKVLVNGESQEIEKIDTAFLGFPIETGTYTITIDYEAPLFQEGKIVSVVLFVMTMTFIYWENREKKLGNVKANL